MPEVIGNTTAISMRRRTRSSGFVSIFLLFMTIVNLINT
jgi:hypothetical protein